MREIIVAGNWKMNTTPWEGAMLARRVVELITGGNGHSRVTIVIFPPFTHLNLVLSTTAGAEIGVGAQNIHWEEKGAYTGEISAGMVHFLGCRWVIIGHSERRRYFGETDETVNLRLKHALEMGLRPVVCIGETLEEREAGHTFKVLERQLGVGLEGVSLEGYAGVVIAYEPVWAIGTGHNATREQAEEAHEFIRSTLKKLYNQRVADTTAILYGGSVTDANAPELMACPNVDGALVGGASLKPEQFAAIARAAGAAHNLRT
jgi:triosephosphate isomerase